MDAKYIALAKRRISMTKGIRPYALCQFHPAYATTVCWPEPLSPLLDDGRPETGACFNPSTPLKSENQPVTSNR